MNTLRRESVAYYWMRRALGGADADVQDIINRATAFVRDGDVKHLSGIAPVPRTLVWKTTSKEGAPPKDTRRHGADGELTLCGIEPPPNATMAAGYRNVTCYTCRKVIHRDRVGTP